MFLKECKVDTVAMEATGFTGKFIFSIRRWGFDVVLVTAKHVKRERKQMLAMLIGRHTPLGLLSASFQPDKFTRKLRAYASSKNLLKCQLHIFACA
ncbi:MAG: hypothetical protein IPI90_06905 [Saprospiraceae bacterium]|nr:hypothetical protein [Candidatus Vicinibacter affinis]